VENKPGAGGNLGGVEAARSAPDGYTLFMSTSGIQAINPALYAKMPFDPNKDLVPVAALVSLNNVLVLHPSVPAKSVKEVIELAKKDPGKWTYASSGNGTSIHMSGAMFTQLTGTDLLHVPYKGSGPAVTDLLGGQVHMMFDNIPSSLPHIKSGKLRALATTGAKRDPALPDLPTLAESGIRGYESGVWFGVMVPAGTPKDIIARLNAATVQATKSPEFIKRMTDLGYNIIPSTPDEMAAMIKAEIARWAPIVKASGAKVD
jgi:tripartite-type tricarboxylate transporter receptor subunit TctC